MCGFGQTTSFPGLDLTSSSPVTAYNYFRDYDPALGRYVESDLIGLDGGINTYAYTFGSPLALVNPSGLAPRIKICVNGVCPPDPPVPLPPDMQEPSSPSPGLPDWIWKPSPNLPTWTLPDWIIDLARDPKAAGNGGVGNSSGIGTNTPYKHCRDLKGRPGWIECKDKKSGKWIPKPAPPGWPFKKEMCEV